MGAMVTLRYTDKVMDKEAIELADAVRSLIKEVMVEKDVFIYVDKAPLTIGADPIELFIQVNSDKVRDAASLMDKFAEKLTAWKQQNNFARSINLNVIPVKWHARFGI